MHNTARPDASGRPVSLGHRMTTYTVAPTPRAPDLAAPWDDPAWTRAKPLEIAHFRPECARKAPEAKRKPPRSFAGAGRP